MFKPTRSTLDPNIDQKVDFSKPFVEQGAKSTHPFHLSLINIGCPFDEIFAEIFKHPTFGEHINYSLIELNGELKTIYPLNTAIINYLYFFREYSEHKMPVEVNRDPYWIAQTIVMALRDGIIHKLITKLKAKYPFCENAELNSFSHINIIRNSLPLVDLWLEDILAIEQPNWNQGFLISNDGQRIVGKDEKPIRIIYSCINLCKFCFKEFEGEVPPENLCETEEVGQGCKHESQRRNRNIIFPKIEEAQGWLEGMFGLLFHTDKKPDNFKELVKKSIEQAESYIEEIAQLYFEDIAKKSPFICDFYNPFTPYSEANQVQLMKNRFLILSPKELEIFKKCKNVHGNYWSFDWDVLKAEFHKIKGGKYPPSRCELHKKFLLYLRGPKE